MSKTTSNKFSSEVGQHFFRPGGAGLRTEEMNAYVDQHWAMSGGLADLQGVAGRPHGVSTSRCTAARSITA